MITVVIPVYNCEKYVGRAIQSILNQPCADQAEILVVNDGSKDRSGEICDQYASQNANVRVLHKENGGVSSARNLGIEQAKGNYIAFLDSDDWWEPNFLDEDMVAKFAIGGGGADVYEFAFREVDRFIKLERIYPCENEILNYEEGGFRRYDWTSPCRFCYNRQFLYNSGVEYPIAKSGEDGPFVEMALYHARTFQKVNRIMFSYWENPESCVHTTSKINAILASYEALKQEERHFSTIGVSFDADEGFVWQSVVNLPKICGTHSFAEAKEFMDNGCMKVLENRADIRFGKVTWGKLEAWRENPCRYWLKQQIVVGIPLRCKMLANAIPGIRVMVSYAFNRYHRKFSPIQ